MFRFQSVGRYLVGAVAALILSAPSANATTIAFSYLDSSNNPVATGQFTYTTGATGVLGYGDLSSFTVNTGFNTYTLADVAGFTDYLWFAYDTAANVFVTGTGLCGFGGCGFSASLAALNSVGSSGFFFQQAPGQFADYQNFNPVNFATIQLVEVVPEPTTLLLLGTGLGVASVRRRLRRRA